MTTTSKRYSMTSFSYSRLFTSRWRKQELLCVLCRHHETGLRTQLGKMAFGYAHNLTGRHLIVQPSDALLSPPESYLFVQDFLIISCGVLYAFCYFFYMLRTVKDKTLAGPVEYL